VSAISAAIATEQILFIDAAVEAGVKRFLPSEFGIDGSLPALKDEPLLASKVKVEEHLVEVAKHGKITYTVIPTGAFAEWALTVGFLGFDVKTQEATFHENGKNPFPLIHRADIGKYVAAALKHHELSANKRLRFAGFYANQHEILQSLEKVTGKKWTVKAHLTTAEARKNAQEAISKGEVLPWIVSTLHAIIFSGSGFFPSDNYLFPEVRPQTLDETIIGLFGDHRHAH